MIMQCANQEGSQLNNFAVGISTSPFIARTSFGAFIFFGAITSIGALWVYLFMPETNSRTLEEMDELFGAAGMAEDEREKQRIEKEIGLWDLLGIEYDSGTATEARVEVPEQAQTGSDENVEKTAQAEE
jgi:hypothetical protein